MPHVSNKIIPLVQPVNPQIFLLDAILNRKTERDFNSTMSVTKEELSTLLFAANGITHGMRFRTVPSAGATFSVFLITALYRVNDVEPGIYVFEPEKNALNLIQHGFFMKDIQKKALNQAILETCAATIWMVCRWERIEGRYGKRGRKYAYQESGHMAQNIQLMAGALSVKSVVVGAFDEQEIATLFKLERLLDDLKETPIYCVAVGK